ncbi:radical SAM protein [Hydrogenophaga sp.]|uniref:B12-binding domain-containing radical SAM protein n=1 Tax=Hydrogenophaga sp. TaxID=1904254 RepID=UPI00272247F6|nr:B12-binding domain-containing radical SAM protein [Hydrogenophaga sp.]MDO8903686.1 B12-binding domain-containing radical SAM protein [Hydrogenophaga sp.]
MTSEFRVLSLIPPMTQLNTPYPSTAYLTGFLRSRGVDAVQADLALALVLKLFTPAGLEAVRGQALELPERDRTGSVHAFLDQFDHYRATIGPVIRFLQGRDSTLAHRIAARGLLPEGPRFAALDAYEDDGSGDPLAWAFGALGVQDKARHLCTLYLNDLADVLRDAVDDRFEFVRYAESLASSQPTFDPLAQALAAPPTLVDRLLQDLTLAALAQHQPALVLLSVPFPGSVYAALRIAQTIKTHNPMVHIALGGGFVNTELRELSDPRLFDFVDYVTLDAGERPVLALMEHLRGQRSRQRLVRTFMRNEQGQVQYINLVEPDIPFEDVGTPTWDGLPLDHYLSLLDMLNPMHRLWSDGRWNKLTVAHGCYWKKCSFCDVSLDYIGRYETATATTLVDRIEAIVNETGQTGFHFVDEAAPPKALKALAQELIRRQLNISWWGNIRFEKTFTPELAELLAQSGCIAMSGGLEVASDRLLTLMKKGVSVEQVARVTKGFSDAGILVHAYLMYGFPTQTLQDTVDALEYVRQLFEAGCIQSGFFHRFSCTVHSPVGMNPAEYGIELVPLPPVSFAKNDIGFHDPTGTDHEALGIGLRKAIYNYMHGLCVEDDVRRWFEHLPQQVPRATVKRNRIAKALSRPGATA